MTSLVQLGRPVAGPHAAAGRFHRARWWPTLVVACLAVWVGACGGSQKGKVEATPKTVLVIRSDENTNAGRPLQVLVRAVELQAFLEDSYATVAGLVITPDDTVLAGAVLFPGHELRLSIERPTAPIAVYFLFTEPGSPWKMQLEPPLKWRVEFQLGEHSILEPE
ncbi:hypothetical protein [Haliangium sp.]|uniref:hypothetical protein n=1 Tax=Haliangium sp. TaxID=2663208 RepID=UPI003D0F7BD5